MKRALLGLTAGALALSFAPGASAAYELPKPRGYVQYCGTTVMTPCAFCVALGPNTIACIPL